MNRPFFSVLIAALAVVLSSTAPSNAFQDADQTSATPENRSLTRALGIARPGFSRRGKPNPMQEAMQALKEAEGDDAKAEAEDKIRELLEVQYDQFLDANKKQIEELQTRLDNLKDQLERRRRAKSKMVDLEIQRVINESEGLIWPNDKSNGNRANTIYRNFGRTSSQNPFDSSIRRVPAPTAATTAPADPIRVLPRNIGR